MAGLVDQVVSLAGSAVASSSAATYEAHRRRYLEFVTESLGASVETAFPPGRDKDLNRVVVCLFIVHASSRWSRSTIEHWRTGNGREEYRCRSISGRTPWCNGL